MRLPTPLHTGRLVRRYKRFLADIRLDDDSVVVAHCPNPGSMKGCLKPNGRVLLSESDNPARKLRYTWELARIGRVWVGLNTLRTNRVVEEALRKGRVPELTGYDGIRPEAKMGRNRRVDFLLTRGEEQAFVEVKNVTMAEGKTALFPDSVTTRGSAHLVELAERVREGHRAVMLYCVNRSDCDRAGPAADIDPAYAENLDMAVKAGVETLAYRTKVGKGGITLTDRIPFVLKPSLSS
jgi:sugar fermentation stimulation protein A